MMEILQQPLTTELKHTIYAGFKEHSIQVMGRDGLHNSIAFVAMENNKCIGAVVAQPFWGALHIKYVWVHEAHRQRKVGTRLLQKALDHGEKCNYLFSFVETMSFQALEFYQKLGFSIEFTRNGYAEGLAFHYLRKNFSHIEFKRLEEINESEVIALMNHPQVRQHMPLLTGHFDSSKYDSFIRSKQNMWEEHGCGPWAFVLNGDFIGWGGLQPVDQDTEIALVLHPKYWGYGKRIYQAIIQYAFEKLSLDSVIILFPPTRTRIKALTKLGFVADGEYEFSGKRYIRYRLHFTQTQDIGKLQC